VRILLGIHDSQHLHGTQTWAYTLAGALRGLGHQVDVVAGRPGQWADRLGCRRAPAGPYDWTLFSSYELWEAWARTPGLGRRAFVAHGKDCPWDTPAEGADLYLAVSPEMVDHLADEGITARLLPQPIDTELFSPGEPIGPTPRRVLVSDQDAIARDLILEVCRERGLEADVLTDTWDTERRIFVADVVIGVGRLALEGMACACSVIVAAGWRESTDGCGDGLMTDATRRASSRCNYIGRAFRLPLTAAWLHAQLDGYDRAQGPANRAWVCRHHEATMIAERLVEYLEGGQETA